MGATRAPRARGRAARTAPALEKARKGCTSAPFLRREGTWVSGALRRGSLASDLNGRQRDRRQSRGYYRGNSLVTVRRDFAASSAVASITSQADLHLMTVFSPIASHSLRRHFALESHPECPVVTQSGMSRSSRRASHYSHLLSTPFPRRVPTSIPPAAPPASRSRSRCILPSISLERSAGRL